MRSKDSSSSRSSSSGDTTWIDVVHLAAEQLECVVADRLGGRDHLAEVEQRLHQRGRVGVDLLGEVGQRRAAGQPDGLAVAVRQPHAADDRRLHVLVLGAFRPLRLTAALGCAAGTTERTCRTATLTGTTAAATGTTAIAAASCGCAAAAGAAATGSAGAVVTAPPPPPGRPPPPAPPPGPRPPAAGRGPPPGRGRRRLLRRGDGAACCRARRRAAGRRRGAARPGRGACGRGIGRSTGCAEENGLFPTRGVRGAGLGPGAAGLGPGVGAGPGVRVREPTRPRVLRPRRAPRALRARVRGSYRCGRLGGRRLLRRGGLRGRLLGGRAVAVGLGLLRRGLCSAEGFAQPARDGGLHGGGCGFDEFALFTQSGEHFLAGYTEFFSQLVYAGLACHFSPVLEATAVVGRASGLAMTHGHRLNFTVCSCSSLPVLSPRAGALRLSRSAPAPRMFPVSR